MDTPYLSFVLGSRNDDYAEGMLRRLQATLQVFINQLEKHGLDTEIILVEWNPPPDQKPLAQALSFPSSSPHVTVRIITVDGIHHQRYRDWQKKPIHVGVVYNVGIRRARGQFIAHRASDVFYSEALLEFLASKSLSEEKVYRCDRYDVDAAFLEDRETGLRSLPPDLESHIVRHHERLSVPSILGIQDLHTNAGGDFTLMDAKWWQAIRGRYESKSVLIADLDSLVLHSVCAAGAMEHELPSDCRIYKLTHKSMFAINVEKHWEAWQLTLDRFLARFDQGAKIRMRSRFNYPKRRLHGREGVLLDSYEKNFLHRAQKWARGGKPYYLNPPNWGLAGQELPERVVCRAQWEG